MIAPRNKQVGFSAIEAIIVVAILAVLAGVGYWVFTRESDDTDQSATSSQASEEDTTVPKTPVVEEASDLDSASQALDDSDLDAGATDNSQLDTQLDGF